MKKLLLSLAIAVVSQTGAWAQMGYTFSQSTATYANLTTPTVVSVAGWDEDDYTIPLGFSFTFDNLTVNSIIAGDNGSIIFTDSTTTVKGMDGFYADMIDRATTTPSNISYELTGTAGSRIMKVQWLNAGFYGTTAALPGEFINFQIWLYEGSNKIEIHIGSSNVTSASAIFGPAGGPDVGLALVVTAQNFSGIYLQGSPAAPTVVTLTASTTYPSLSGVPVNGTVYNFTRSVSGVAKALNNASVEVYPNPVTETLKFNGLPAGKNATATIYDALGKIVKTEVISADAVMNVSSLKNGTYFVEINSAAGRIGKQIIKQ